VLCVVLLIVQIQIMDASSWRLPTRMVHSNETLPTTTKSQFLPTKVQAINDKYNQQHTHNNTQIIGHPRDVWHLPPKMRAIAFRNWPLLLKLLHAPNQGDHKVPSHLVHDAVLHGAPLHVLKAIILKLDPTSHFAESCDPADQTALHSAVLCTEWHDFEDQHAAIELLLDIFPEACMHRNINGHIPLHLAVASSINPIIVQMLSVTRPLTCLTKDYTGHLPIHLAAMNGNPEAVAVLIDTDPSVCKLRDARGDLPVALLAANSTLASTPAYKTAFKKLRDAFPNSLHMTDRMHKTPLDYVMERGFHDEINILMPKIRIDTMLTKLQFKQILLSKFKGENTAQNLKKLLYTYNYQQPVVDRMFYSKPWKVRPGMAKPIVRAVQKEPHRPTTP
jgi:ankyrin repeat protein